jgi:hypothetical protein
MGAENMLHFIGTIIIGFVAEVLAKLVTPGDKEPQGFIQRSLASLAPSRQPTSGRPLAGMGRIRMPALSELSWAQR